MHISTRCSKRTRRVIVISSFTSQTRSTSITNRGSQSRLMMKIEKAKRRASKSSIKS